MLKFELNYHKVVVKGLIISANSSETNNAPDIVVLIEIKFITVKFIKLITLTEVY